MSYSFNKKSIKTEMEAVSPSQAIVDSNRRNTSLLSDKSWIRKDPDEDEPVDRDPNFGRAVLSRLKDTVNVDSKPTEESLPSPASSSTTVNNLPKSVPTFGGNQEQISKVSPPPLTKTVTFGKSIQKSTNDTKTSKTSVNNTPPSAKPAVAKKSPSLSSFTARVFSSKNTRSTATPVILSPSTSILRSSPAPQTPHKEVAAVNPEIPPKVDTNGSSITTHTTHEVVPPTNPVTTVTTPTMESTSLPTIESSPSIETDLPATVSPTPVQTVHSTLTRRVSERGVCSYCCKPIHAGAKMILEDLHIYSHASCFKCEVCHCPLGDMQAGDSIWIHRGTVNCEGCFNRTRERWHR